MQPKPAGLSCLPRRLIKKSNNMANQYSVEIHDYISDKIAAATHRQKQAEAADDSAASQFYAGQLYELEKIREYMAKNIDLKTQKYY